jgi:hypothetical protein
MYLPDNATIREIQIKYGVIGLVAGLFLTWIF